MRLLTTFLIFLALNSPSLLYAHDHFANNIPVPDWIKQQCCGVADAHHIDPNDVVIIPGKGYQFKNDTHTKIAGQPPTEISPGLVPFNKTLYSPDGEYWIFYGPENPDYLYCIFVPAGSI